MTLKRILCLVLPPILFPAALYADFFNNRNVLLGERAALMGGAYTALSEDVSGAFYNPAGLAFIESSTLSINASIYRYQDASLKIKQDAPNQYELNHSTTSLLFLPSSFGGSIKAGDATLAFSIYQIDRFNVSTLGYVDYALERTTAKFELDSVSYLIGPSLGYRFGSSLSVGVSCFYHYSSAEYTFAQGLENDETSNVLVVTKSSGLTGVFGIQMSLSPEWKLGITYGTETVNIGGENTYSYSDTNIPFSIVVKTDGDIRLPHRTTVGIAYQKKNEYAVAFDVIHYFPMDYPAPYEIASNTNHSDNNHKEKRHYDLSLCSEIFIAPTLMLRGGLFTNTSGATSQNRQSRVDQYGGALGCALVTGEVTVSMGTNIMYGKTGMTRDNLPAPIVSHSSWERLSISLVVGSTAKI